MDAKETTRGARHFGGPHLEFTIDLGHVAIDHLLKLNRCRDTPVLASQPGTPSRARTRV
jgi:hypothetical protein